MQALHAPPESEYCPALQAKHEFAPALEDVPAGQLVQSPPIVAEKYLPAAHLGGEVEVRETPCIVTAEPLAAPIATHTCPAGLVYVGDVKVDV